MGKTLLVMRVALVLYGLGALGWLCPVQAQQSSLFGGRVATLTLNELKGGPNEEWRLVFVSPDGKMREDVKEINLKSERLMERDILLSLGAMPDVYYTQGNVATVGSESYLVTYKLSYTEEDLNQPFHQLEAKYSRARLQTMSRDELVKAIDNVMREMPLSLAMLNLRLVGGVVTLRVFDVDEQLGQIEKRIGQEIDKSQAQRKQAALQTSRLEAIRKAEAVRKSEMAHKAELARKAATAKKEARPATSGARPATQKQ